MKYRVRALCMGLTSRPMEFETVEEANEYAVDIRRIPGMVVFVEEVDE